MELLLYKCWSARSSSSCSRLPGHQATTSLLRPESEEPVLQPGDSDPSAGAEVPVSRLSPCPPLTTVMSFSAKPPGAIAGGAGRGGTAAEPGAGQPPRSSFCSACDQLFLSPHQLQQHLRVTRRVSSSAPCAVVSSPALPVWTSTLETTAVSLISCAWTVAWPLAQGPSSWPRRAHTPILCILVRVERPLSTSPNSFITGVPTEGLGVSLCPQHPVPQRSPSLACH